MIGNYHRPATLNEALRLLARHDVRTVALTGYAALTDTPLSDTNIDEVVDLQAIGLNRISVSGDHLTIEALTRLQAIVDHPDVPDWLRAIVRQEETGTFRNMRTMASVLMNPAPESCLIAALLVANAQVRVRTLAGEAQIGIAAFLDGLGQANPAMIPTSVTLESSGTVRVEKVGRTPADKPIVAAVARHTPAGNWSVAVCGVGARPIVMDPAHIDTLEPFGDFRGSSPYRKAMANILVARVTAIEQQ